MNRPALIIKLYTTLGCHLCDQALAMLQNLATDVTIVEVEIADDGRLLEKYGLIIPVVGVEGCAQEINWPFTASELRSFIGTNVK